MCTDSVKFLFSDKCTMSINSCRELDFLTSPHTLCQSVALGSRSHYSHDGHNGGGLDRDMYVDDDIANCHPSRQRRFKELDSPLRSQASIVGHWGIKCQTCARGGTKIRPNV